MKICQCWEEQEDMGNSLQITSTKTEMKMRRIIHGGLEWNRVTYESANGFERDRETKGGTMPEFFFFFFVIVLKLN